MGKIKKAVTTCIAIAMATSAFVSCTRSGDKALDQVNVSDADINFVKAAAISNFGELTLAKLDTTKSTDSTMKDFGMMMITAHTTAGTQLKSIAAGLGLSAPDTMDDAHTALNAQLMGLSGRAFDSVYIHSQVADHQAAVDLFTAESSGGQHQQIRLFATNLLPTLQAHLDKATALASTY